MNPSLREITNKYARTTKKTSDNFQIKLIDFGLAKYLDKTGHAKVSFSGTVGFMAPEVARWRETRPGLKSPL